jgi:hypothetical protein
LASLSEIFIESVSQLGIRIHDKGTPGGDWLTQGETGDKKSFGSHIPSTNSDRTRLIAARHPGNLAGFECGGSSSNLAVSF